MKNKELCFVELGANHISLALCQIVSFRLERIIFFKNVKIKTQPQRYQSVFEIPLLYVELLRLINQAEQETGKNIFDIIIVASDKIIQVLFTQKNFNFKKSQKISQLAIEKILNSTIKDFYTQPDSENVLLDFICNNYVLDETNIENNPYKAYCQNICINTNIISIKKVFEINISSYFERYKIHIKHYISPCVATYYFIKSIINKNNMTMLVDIGSYTTEYCIAYEDNIIMSSNIEIGGFNISENIAKMYKISIQEADKLKHTMTEENYRINNENKARQLLLQQIEKIKNHCLLQIIKEIKTEIFNHSILKNRQINEIILFGGTSNDKSIQHIFAHEFQTNIKTINNNVYTNVEISQVFPLEILKKENLQLISAINFYCSNLEIYNKAKHGFLFKIPSKISCILKDLLY